MIFERDRLEEGRKRYSLQNAKHWISTETGSHLLLDGEGNVVGGAGGKLKDKKFVKVTRKSKDVTDKNTGGKKDFSYKNIEKLTKKGINKETAKKAIELFTDVAELYYVQDALWAFTGAGQKNRAIEAEKKFKEKSSELDDFAEKNNINLEDLSVPSKEDIKSYRASR